MSSREYLHEKAEESRHNETIAYLMFLAGAVFFVGGVMTNLSLGEDFSWFLIIPYRTEPLAGALLGLALTICGVFLVVVGMAAGVHYLRDRGWYMQQLRKANSLDKTVLEKKPGKNARKKRT
jgi:uncharacterized membrane protein YiaA